MKRFKNNWLKHVLQLGTLAAIVFFILRGAFGETPADVEAYCPFGGLQALGTYLYQNSLACSMSMAQIMMGIILAVGVILFGKLFCGYMCPLGTVSEWLGKGGRAIHATIEIKTGSILDKVLRIVKYVLLFTIFYITVTGSELFCKNFDPYYAFATGFKGELTVWMASISIAVLFLGNFFISMFWCRYICPLGALSNIFKFTLTFIGILLLFWILGMLGLPAAWVWALGAACLVSYIFEIVFQNSKIFPFVHVTRDASACIDCKACTKYCPQRLSVHNVDSVKAVNCTLCGECIAACPKKCLYINKKKSLRWLPAILVPVLFALALYMGAKWELPTIDEKWGNFDQIENLQTFEMEGLSSVKCYGSSMAFKSTMEKVPGVYGVKTYAKRHAVVITYDPAVTSVDKIKEAMFTPTRMKLGTPPAEVQQLSIIQMGVDGLFDRMDVVYLANMFRKVEGVYGVTTEYDCPVIVKLFVDPNATITEDQIEAIVDVKEFEMPGHGGTTTLIPVDYEMKSYEANVDTMGRQEFLEMMFMPITKLGGEFEENVAKYPEGTPTAIYQMEFPGIEKPLLQRFMPYFRAHLSNFDGILALEFTLAGSDVPMLQVKYVKDKWTDDRIWKEIFQAKVWTIHYSDGSVKDEEPKMGFETPGATLK